MKTNYRKDKYRFPQYFLNKEVPVFIKVIAILLILAVILFIIDTIGLTYKPKINVDAYNVQHSISPDLYGYSIDSNFTYDKNLVDAVNQYGAQSMRVLDEYDPGARMLLKVQDGSTKVMAADNIPYEPNRKYQIKIKVNNSNVKIWIDGKQIFDVNDSTYSKGEIGLTSSYNLNTYFDNVVVKNNNNSTIFSDNFSNGLSKWDDGNIPSFYNQGNWMITSGNLKHSGQESISLKRAGDHNWKNYTITADLKSSTNNIYEAGFIGIVFRYNGILNNYKFIWRSGLRQPHVSNSPWSIADYDGQFRFAEETNLKPNMVINMRDHSPQSAANLVRKLNKEQKLNIKYWELGNEIWLWSDYYIHSEQYAQKVKSFSKKMKAVDPSIKIGATTLLGYSDWDNALIREAAPDIDFIIFHFYPFYVQNNISDYHILGSPHAFGHNFKNNNGQGKGIVENAKDLIRREAPGHENRIKFAVTEFNTGDYEQGIDLIYGLTTADLLGEATEQNIKLMQFHKLANETGWQWGAFTEDSRPKPAALAISMFTKHFGQKLLNSSVENVPTFYVTEKINVPGISDIPYMTAYASRSNNDNKLYLMVINKHSAADMRTTINISNVDVSSNANIYTLNGPSIHSDNKYSDNVDIKEKSISNANENFVYNFPAHSVTAIEFNINRLIKPKNQSSPTSSDQTKDAENNQAIGGPENISNEKTKIASSAGWGGNPHVKTFDQDGRLTRGDFFAYDGNFRGGVSIALGDIDGDGQQEIVTGAGPGGGPHVRAFEEDGREIANFFPFDSNFRGGVDVACGDVDGDGRDEIVTSQKSQGQAWVKVYRNDKKRSIIGEWNTFGHVESGASVAMGDVDGDDKDEIIVGAGPGGGPHIRIYEADGTLKPLQFFAFHPDYRGGVSVASGDADGDGVDEIGVSQSGAGNQAWTKIYKYNTEHTILGEWKAYGDIPISANLAMGDINNDGRAEVVTGAGIGGEPHVLSFDPYGNLLPTRFYVFDRAFVGGVDVAVKK